MKTQSIILALIFILQSAFCGEPQIIISTLGTHSVIAGREKIQLTLEAGKLCIMRLSTSSGVSFSAFPGWLVYSDSTDILWSYDGYKEIRWFKLGDGGIEVKESHDLPELWNEAPKPFTEAIPAKKK